MKVLRGTLEETRYGFPKNAKTPPKAIKETFFQENQVTYISDEFGIHKVTNPDLENIAVSLHLCTPPIGNWQPFENPPDPRLYFSEAAQGIEPPMFGT